MYIFVYVYISFLLLTVRVSNENIQTLISKFRWAWCDWHPSYMNILKFTIFIFSFLDIIIRCSLILSVQYLQVFMVIRYTKEKKSNSKIQMTLTFTSHSIFLHFYSLLLSYINIEETLKLV